MLDAFIIDEIINGKERKPRSSPRVSVPERFPPSGEIPSSPTSDEGPSRGYIIIDPNEDQNAPDIWGNSELRAYRF